MKLQDWGDRWAKGQIGFHQASATDALVTYADTVWGSAPIGRVLVPLCGKSLDLEYLAQRSEAVVGVEYAVQAIEEFFAERELSPAVEPGTPARYRLGRYDLFAGDFFDVTTEHVGVVDAAFDRAALVALEADVRVRYVAHMRSLLPAGAKTLLVTFDYDQSQMNGPPFAVSDDEVRSLYRDGFDLEHLETRDVLNDVFRGRGLQAMTESAFVVTRR